MLCMLGCGSGVEVGMRNMSLSQQQNVRGPTMPSNAGSYSPRPPVPAGPGLNPPPPSAAMPGPTGPRINPPSAAGRYPATVARAAAHSAYPVSTSSTLYTHYDDDDTFDASSMISAVSSLTVSQALSLLLHGRHITNKVR